MQETLLKTWNRAPGIRRQGENSLLRFAITVARNLSIDEIKKKGHEVPIPDAGGEELFDIAQPGPSDPFLRKRILECIERLPRQPRRALRARLRNAGARADAFIAKEIQMTLNTFHINIKRAREKMRSCLEAHGVRIP